VNVKANRLPPIADPALWRVFIGNAINPTDVISARVEQDEWQFNEFHGDKIMAKIVIDLCKKYSLPNSWSNSLLRALGSNDYQKKMSNAQGLPSYLLGGNIRKKGTADTLEVLKFVFLIPRR
jgi:hypothetical protein